MQLNNLTEAKNNYVIKYIELKTVFEFLSDILFHFKFRSV